MEKVMKPLVFLYGLVGARYPRLSLMAVVLVAAVIAGSCWWLAGRYYVADRVIGRWILHQYESSPQLKEGWMVMQIDGGKLTVYGNTPDGSNGWSGTGEFDGRKGHYNWRFADGRTGQTQIVLDEDNGILYGKVQGSGIDWVYWATRGIAVVQSAAAAGGGN